MDDHDGFPDTQFDTALAPVEALAAGFSLGGSLSGPVAQLASTALRGDTHGASRQGFRIGELSLMIRFEDGSELTELPVLHSLPNAPSWFLGMANLHGALIPVFDIASFAGLDASRSAQRMLLVLSHGDDAAGIVIDGLPRRLKLPVSGLASAATASPGLAPYVRGTVLLSDELWFDLDGAALLGALEQALAAH